jgi:superfamily I DNA/RNA helicase
MELSKVRDPQNRISFDDMVWLPMAMNWVRPQFKLVVIDEAQDMNHPQLMMAIAACSKGGRIIVVGDSHQAIYGFRGAVSNGMNMMKDRLQAKSLGLTVTYRCPQLVVAKSQKLVPAYKAAPEAPQGEVSELNYNALLGAVKIGDAVLSRLNAPLMPLCLKCLRNGVAARIEGRDVGASLNSIVKKLHAKSIPHLLEKLENWGDKMRARAAKSKNADAKIEAINDQVLTLSALAEGCAGLDELSHRIISMFEDSDRSPKPAVVFSSVHKAKGLEWNNVYTLSDTFGMKFGDPEEEKNIQYVAWTRAKKHLIEVYPE